MRVAILHDYLNQFGGAERVLQVFLEIFPEADIYTLLYDDKRTFSLFRGKIAKTSFLNFPYARNHHRIFIPIFPFVSRFIKSDKKYDLLISSTTGYAKGFQIKGKHHIAYCHTVLPYAWEDEYLKTLPYIPSVFLNLARAVAGILRAWDKKTVKNVNLFIANSNFIAERIKKFYERDAAVVYPPVDNDKFYYEPRRNGPEDYYLMAGRLVFYKRFDLGIKAFEKLKKKLKIVGDGFAASKLKESADPKYVDFLPFVNHDELRELYLNAKALIFPQIEHFGLVAAEAQACGLPVLAFKNGGALEIVEDGKTGLFFKEQTPEAIVEAVKKFENIHFDRNYISKSAARFSKDKFKDRIKEIVNYAQNSSD